MALVAVSSNFSRIILYPAKPNVVKKLCNSHLPAIYTIKSAGIMGKAYRDPTPKKAPYPYKEKDYGVIRSWFDRTTHRFDENSKVIAVEGPVASGKTEFAKQLAEELGMKHFSEANMDIVLINPYGYDMRQLDPKLPPSLRSFDEKNFCMDPCHVNAASFQMWMYRLRYSVYIDALAHLLSSGQGVVLERSPWSDFVFVEAMFKSKYMSPQAKSVYYEVRSNCLDYLIRPHLVIYLDVPVSCVMDKIKKRNHSHEVKGKALTEKFLTDMEHAYKQEYLPGIEEHSELLMYDWSEPGDVEAVVEDLERMDFDKYTVHDKKMKDWFKSNEQEWSECRRLYCDQKEELMMKLNVPLFHAPELIASGEDIDAFINVWENAPGMKYEIGYNADLGDTNILTKIKTPKYIPY